MLSRSVTAVTALNLSDRRTGTELQRHLTLTFAATGLVKS